MLFMNDIIRNFYPALVLVIDNFFQFYRPKTMELHKVLLEYEFFSNFSWPLSCSVAWFGFATKFAKANFRNVFFSD